MQSREGVFKIANCRHALHLAMLRRHQQGWKDCDIWFDSASLAS
ncbi:hypothetical protein [Thermosporothrix hazakensis]|nr:hypothetical protein [Thermosporothrix hazakensis]